MTRGNTEISGDEFKDRVVELCLKSGACGLPRKTRDRHIVLKSVALTLDPKAIMTPKEIDVAIERWIRVVAQRLDVDRVTLRRHLVDEGYLRRSRRGELYTVKNSEWRPGFAVAVEGLDMVGVALHGMCDIEKRRRERFPEPDSAAGKKIVKAREVARQLLDDDLEWGAACDTLRRLFDNGQPFLSDLTYFYCGYWEMHDDELLVHRFAQEFLEKSDEWIRWLWHG